MEPHSHPFTLPWPAPRREPGCGARGQVTEGAARGAEELEKPKTTPYFGQGASEIGALTIPLEQSVGAVRGTTWHVPEAGLGPEWLVAVD